MGGGLAFFEIAPEDEEFFAEGVEGGGGGAETVWLLALYQAYL